MKVVELIKLLERCHGDDEVVVQVGHGDGYYSHHELTLQDKGHPGHNGPIIHIGQQVEDRNVEAT